MNTLILTSQKNLMEEKRAMPLPGAGEVIVKTAYCGICRTDRKSYQRGQKDLCMPRVLGHEFSGYIAATGEGVENHTIGDRVAVYPGIGCGECTDCREGNDQRCRDMRIMGFHSDGGFSRYVRIPAEAVARGCVMKVAEHVSLIHAAMCEPLGCAVHMLNAVDLGKIRNVLICGGGVLGFMMASLLKKYGCENIIISEPNKEKRKFCQRSNFIALHSDELVSFSEENYPLGMDAIIPCCPDPRVFEISFSLLKNGGFFGFFSGLVGNGTVSVDILNEIHYKECTVVGAYGCGRKDFTAAMTLLENGFDLSALPVTLIPLKNAEQILRCEETEHSVLTMIDYEMEVQV